MKTTDDLNQNQTGVLSPGPNFRHALTIARDIVKHYDASLSSLEVAHFILKGAQLRDAERQTLPCWPSDSQH